jgi:hypothetical protein
MFIDDLPKPVAEVVRGCERYASSAAIVVCLLYPVWKPFHISSSQMALLATIHAVFLQMLMEDRNIVRNEARWEALRWFSYSGLIVDATGSISAVMCLNTELSLTARARDEIRENRNTLPNSMFREGVRRRDIVPQGGFTARIMTRFGFGYPMIIHFIYFHMAFIFGILFFLVTITLWIWCNERKVLAISLLPILVTGFIPLLLRWYHHDII